MKAFLLVLALGASLSSAIIPANTSLATVPVGYFGGNSIQRGDANIAMLAKMRIVMIEKWEGPCFQNCLEQGINSTYCLSSCGVENYILNTMQRVKDVNPGVATILYWNAMLAFPFYTAVGKFEAANALTIDSVTGKPIKIRNDAGMENIGVFGFDTEVGQQLYVETVKNLTSVFGGVVDGFFGDKFAKGATENSDGVWQLCNHECGTVTKQQAQLWNDGKLKVLKTVNALVGKGPYFANGEEFMGVGTNFDGYWKDQRHLRKGDPRDLISDVLQHLSNHTYLYQSCTADQKYNVDPNNASSLVSQCDDDVLARFLLAVEEGCFLGANGWDPAYDLPLGDPLGPAVFTAATGGAAATLTRNFTSGTYVRFEYNKDETDGSGEVWWGGKPPALSAFL